MRQRVFRRFVLPASGVLVFWSGMNAQAQLSPGPLARAHADLDSATQCFACHGGRLGSAGIDARCVECHSEIAWQTDNGVGLHGREGLAACSKCHPDHAGADFDLIEWTEGSAEAFDHRRTGWPLGPAHRRLDCAQCHKAQFQSGEVVRLMRRKSPGSSWLGLEPSCAGCHTDSHRGTLGDDCARCHTESAWKPATGFAHDRTRYPLDGKHVGVECAKCHGPREQDKAVFSPVAYQECSACHDDVHRGALGPGCSSCHSTAGFKVLSLDGFDHSRTRFTLLGKHRTLECAKCHDPSSGTYKKDNFSTCVSCHTDAHAGTARWQGVPADCAVCHDERAFRPSTLTAVDHDRSAYKLEGAHRAVSCEKCHAKDLTKVDRWGVAAIRLQPAYDSCASCHGNAHASQLDQRADGGACESCHTVSGWSPSTFGTREHEALDFWLTGAHARAKCKSCHGPQRADLAALPADSELGRAGIALTRIERRCADCHVDVHEGQLEGTCDRCHGTDGFRPSTVDGATHESFRYALVGAHATVPCIDCHGDLARPARRIHLLRADAGAPLSFAAPRDPCSSCHASPHAGQFGERESDCATCHDERGFVPAARFDHDSAFALVGEHRGVACAQCHVRQIGADGTEFTVYRPLSKLCESCHRAGIPQSDRAPG